eukprot:76778-Hanusia_phi.AAC.1
MILRADAVRRYWHCSRRDCGSGGGPACCAPVGHGDPVSPYGPVATMHTVAHSGSTEARAREYRCQSDLFTVSQVMIFAPAARC